MASSGILFTILTAVLWSGIAAGYRKAGKTQTSLLSLGLIISCMVTTISFLIALPSLYSGFNRERLVPMAVMMAVSGMTSQCAMIMMARAMNIGHSAITWVITQSAIAISFLYTIVFLNQTAQIHHTTGLVLLMLSFVLHARKKKNDSRVSSGSSIHWLFLTILSFCFIGASQCLILTISSWKDMGAEVHLRIPISFFAAACLFAILCIARKTAPDRGTLKFGIPMAAIVSGGQFTLFIAADRLSAVNLSSIVFPVAIGGSILGFSLVSRFILKERFTKRTWAGIVLNTIAIILLAIT